MPQIISIHSFRGGTGKSNTTANVAALLALPGRRVGVIDTDIQSPGIHVLFGVKADQINYSLNDYLWGNCALHETAQDVTPNLGQDFQGKVFLIPSSMKPNDIARVLRERYNVRLLHEGFRKLITELELDVLMIDTHPGLNEETLLSIAMSDALAIVMRPDEQDYEGTGVTVQVARKLKVPRLALVVNKTPTVFDFAEVKAHVETTYGCEVAAVMPHSDELMILSSKGVFALRYPDHPVTALYQQIATRLVM
jgi:MinD-like ATPase involved in chromosome partitioning or flagellar assembly